MEVPAEALQDAADVMQDLREDFPAPPAAKHISEDVGLQNDGITPMQQTGETIRLAHSALVAAVQGSDQSAAFKRVAYAPGLSGEKEGDTLGSLVVEEMRKRGKFNSAAAIDEWLRAA